MKHVDPLVTMTDSNGLQPMSLVTVTDSNSLQAMLLVTVTDSNSVQAMSLVTVTDSNTIQANNSIRVVDPLLCLHRRRRFVLTPIHRFHGMCRWRQREAAHPQVQWRRRRFVFAPSTGSMEHADQEASLGFVTTNSNSLSLGSMEHTDLEWSDRRCEHLIWGICRLETMT